MIMAIISGVQGSFNGRYQMNRKKHSIAVKLMIVELVNLKGRYK